MKEQSDDPLSRLLLGGSLGSFTILENSFRRPDRKFLSKQPCCFPVSMQGPVHEDSPSMPSETIRQYAKYHALKEKGL